MLVLAALAMISFLALVILTYTRSENRSSRTAAELVQVRMLAEIPEKLVISQIRRATKGLGSGYTWTSQPGMIRVFGTKTSGTLPRADAEEFFKLYSSRAVTLPGDKVADLLEDTDEFSSANWGGLPLMTQAMYADLNEPVPVMPKLKQGQAQNKTTTSVYPIFDPAGIGIIDGYDYKTDALQSGRVNAHPYPMPVLWLYVLRDGTLVAPQEKNKEAVSVIGATKENPIVGRIAYWTDDESCKLNINTATEPAAWEAPHTHTTADEAAAESIPAKGDFYRMAGHPAYTSLAPALRNLGATPKTGFPSTVGTLPVEREPQDPIADGNEWWEHLQSWHALLPRTFHQQGSATGSEGGTAKTDTETLTKQERLFTTVDELFYNSERDFNNGGTAGPVLTQEGMRAARFVLTTHNRSPELTPFNRPKISLWPVQNDASKHNEVDKAFVTASTLGTAPYYLKRASEWQSETSPGSSQDQDADMQLPSNEELFQYVLRQTTMNIPGFGHRFVDPENAASGKYSLASCDQLVASMFDMMRWGINPATPYNQRITHPLTPQYSFLAPGFGEPGTSQGVGGWSAVPMRVQGFGETVEARLLPPGSSVTQWARGYGRFPTIIEAAIVFAPVEVDLELSGQPLNVDAHSDFADRTNKIQAFLVIQPYVTAAGVPPVAPVFEYRVVDLDDWTLDGEPLNLPANAANVVSFSPANTAVAGNKALGGGSTAYAGLAAQFLQASGAPKTFRDPLEAENAESQFAFVSSSPVRMAADKGKADTELSFSGGTIKIQINDNTTGATSQVLEFHFPATTIPSPLLAMTDAVKVINVQPAAQLLRRFTPTPGDGPDSPPRMGDLILRGDVVRGVGLHGEPVRMYPVPGIGSVGAPAVPSITQGDVRLLAGRASAAHTNAPNDAEFFAPHPFYHETKLSTAGAAIDSAFKAASLRDGAHMREQMFPPFPTDASAGKLVGRMDNNFPQAVAPNLDSIPAVPVGTMGAFNLDLRPGDFDNGPGIVEDGPYINAPDFNNIANEVAAKSGWFKRGGEFAEEDGITFSPWRQSASAVMFGSLPTGVYGTGFDAKPAPWQTLLFCPNPASRTTAAGEEPGWTSGSGAKKDHFGFATPRDHLWLEYFRMPVIEPTGFADNVSTEGKVNMNYQLMPFTWIKRSTAMLGALHGVRITAIPTTAVNASAGSQHYKDPVNASALQFRYEVDANKTLQAFEDRFNGANGASPDVFRSPSEICEMWLVPKRLKNHQYASGNVSPQDPATTIPTYRKTLDWWEGPNDNDPADGFEATGDNLREAPYAQLYPRLCTRSNVFTVHYRVQLLNKSRTSKPEEWDESKDNVAADYRGQTTVERYLDQSDPLKISTIPNFITNPAPERALDDYYRIRVVNRRVFAP